MSAWIRSCRGCALSRRRTNQPRVVSPLSAGWRAAYGIPLWGSLRSKKTPPPCISRLCSALPSHHRPSLCGLPPLLLTPLRRLVSLVGTLLRRSSPPPKTQPASSVPACLPACRLVSPITPVNREGSFSLHSLSLCLLSIPSLLVVAFYRVLSSIYPSIHLPSIYPSRHPILGAWYRNRRPDIILLFLGRKYLITLDKGYYSRDPTKDKRGFISFFWNQFRIS